MENQEVKKFKTKAEYVQLMKREFTEIESIMENVAELKAQAKEAVIGIGGVLTVISAAVYLVEYYPIKFSDLVVSKFKKGNK